MVDLQYKQSISEVLDILKHMDKSYTEKIPNKFKELLEKNQQKEYISNLDYSKSLKEMNLNEETKNLLAVIYLNFWCNDLEKKEFKKTLEENQKKLDKKNVIMYSYDNLFENKKNEKIIQNVEQKDISKDLSLEETSKKLSVFKRIINFFKSFLN